MAEQTLEQVELTIKWHMVPDDDNVIKFTEREETYEMTDAVKQFIKDKNISQTAKVKVSINLEGGEDKKPTVERIEVVEDNAKKEETTKDAPEKETALDVKELTVGGVSVEKKNIIFKEEDGVWYQLADDIDAQKVKDDMTHQTVKVSITKVDGEKDCVDSIELSGNPSSESDKGKSESRTENGTIQSSIESQIAIEHACVIVSRLVDASTKSEKVLAMVKDLATQNYNLMQEFKKK